MRKLGKFILVILVILIIVGGIFYFMPKYSTESEEPDYTMAIFDLNQAFTQNEASATTKYVGKVIATEGVVKEISKDLEGNSVLLLSQTKADQPILLVTMEDGESKKASTLKIGDKVSIKGKCAGQLLEVVMKNGIFLD